ncbi:MAG: hypothetical protein L7F78_21050 [Syntrophales bacterium LBB04]|nr:hypothetical protein [Syntrophales bacterium LBB04]
MPSLETHCAESLRLFGEEFEDVHRWLDEFAGSQEYGFRHRHKRHHLGGINRAAKLFGEKAALAARQHVISDLQEEGWTEADPFPRDEVHFRRMGLF